MRPADFWPGLIRELCREQGISERRLARETGINRATIRRYLINGQPPHADKLEIILAFFGYELDAFPRRRAA